MPTTLATDDFNRIGPGLGADWSVARGNAWMLVTDAVWPDTAGDETAEQHSVSVPANQYAEISISSLIAGVFVGCAVRITGSAYYAAYLDTSAAYLFSINSDGSYGSLYDEAFGVFSSPATLRLEADGSTITAFLNGSVLLSGSDSALPSGGVGIAGYGAGISQITAWEAGSLADGTPEPRAMVGIVQAYPTASGISHATSRPLAGTVRATSRITGVSHITSRAVVGVVRGSGQVGGLARAVARSLVGRATGAFRVSGINRIVARAATGVVRLTSGPRGTISRAARMLSATINAAPRVAASLTRPNVRAASGQVIGQPGPRGTLARVAARVVAGTVSTRPLLAGISHTLARAMAGRINVQARLSGLARSAPRAATGAVQGVSRPVGSISRVSLRALAGTLRAGGRVVASIGRNLFGAGGLARRVSFARTPYGAIARQTAAPLTHSALATLSSPGPKALRTALPMPIGTGTMILFTEAKDPLDTTDWPVAYNVPGNATLTQVTATSDDLTVVSIDVQPRLATFWLSGGTVGQQATVYARFVDSAGRIINRRLKINVKDL